MPVSPRHVQADRAGGGGNLKKVSLELGGNSPAIAFPDADKAVAARL